RSWPPLSCARRSAPTRSANASTTATLTRGREAELSRTMNISAFDHPLLGALLGDEEVAAFLSVDADLAAMLAFEAALAEAQAALGLLPTEAARHIAEVCASFSPD